MTEEQLSALLRIKRFEQPPPQYFDQLLQNLHRRQRAELLRRPLWKIAAERLQTFFSEHSMGNLSYAGALASALVVGVVGIGLMTADGGVDKGTGSGPGLAMAKAVQVGHVENVVSAGEKVLALETSRPRLGIGPATLPAVQAVYAPGNHEPRYIIDPLPVRYDLPDTY
jgi:hypothetical protein